MKFTNFCLLFLMLILTFSANAQRLFKGQVTDVINGKTLVVTTESSAKVTIQLPFIEVPETGQPLNEIVKDHLRQIALEKKVDYYAIGLTGSAIVLAKVFINGTDLSQQMLRDGAAWYNIPDDNFYTQNDREFYKDTENVAKGEKRGVWGVSELKPAWEYRAELQAKQWELKNTAEKAAARESMEREIARKSSRPTDEERRKANENVRVWADVYRDAGSKDYVSSYDTGKNTTSLKSPSIALLSAELTDKDSLTLSLTHSFAGKDVKKATDDYYVFDLTLKSRMVEADKSSILDLSSAKKGNKLVFSIGQNKYTLEFLNYKSGTAADPKDLSGKTVYKNQMLTFKMSKKDFQNLVKATEVDFEINLLKGTIAGEEWEIIKKVP